MKPIAYYITAHGYGHGARSCDVLRALHRLAPEQPVIVTTDLPRDFLNSRLSKCDNLTFRPGAFDVGLVQIDSIHADLSKTLDKLEELNRNWEKLISQERLFIQHKNIGVVAADIPAIPLAAAQRSGIPNIAIGNFSWDWIYADFAKTDLHWEYFVEKFREVYTQTDLLLRLPFAPPMEQFTKHKEVPLLATTGAARRDQIQNLLARQNLGEDAKHQTGNPERPQADKPWVLLSFTSLDLNKKALENIRALSGEYEFFCVEPLRFENSCIHSISPNVVAFSDILASCDIVVSKPGFGLVSECIVNNKPLIYSDRGDFAEYPYLIKGIEKYLQNIYLPSEKLYAGELRSSLEAIQKTPFPTEFIKRSGAEMIAEELLAVL